MRRLQPNSQYRPDGELSLNDQDPFFGRSNFLIPKIDKEVQRLPSGFENEQICIENFVVASDRIRIEASGSDGVSYE